jgi:hypothetical protein
MAAAKLKGKQAAAAKLKGKQAVTAQQRQQQQGWGRSQLPLQKQKPQVQADGVEKQHRHQFRKRCLLERCLLHWRQQQQQQQLRL